ncbi:hypothetical protein GCM10010384_24620 [Streptomyces djakartensis]|uniref:Uncharacterized protein n=1 Tax=Streptomyces djakartensis TaxID=68193 RepID=A0ABQ2ZMQ0_9ACTN|nr:hypothetical protein GCM10010384_24620 [Streptomyces djakartensis]
MDHSFLRVDVTPAPKGRHTTLKVRGIAGTGERIDHFTVARRAEQGPRAASAATARDGCGTPARTAAAAGAVRVPRTPFLRVRCRAWC